MINSIQDNELKKLTKIGHAFFTRQGGVSEGIYASLNCDSANADNPENVIENRRRAMVHLGCTLDALVTVRNVHGNKVAIVDTPWAQHQKPQADAMVTKKTKIVLGSDSADCPIVLFADEKASVIGLAHAGWRGAKNGIIQETIKQMIFLGAEPNNIFAAINPCIAQDSYEVSADFYQEFINDNSENEAFFGPSKKAGYFMFNLPGYVKHQLKQQNIHSISETGIDTYTDEERFFSCRRSAHRGEKEFGGHLSCIYLK